MKTVIVTELPNCSFCEMEGKTKPAEYDGRTVIGQWAFMCQQHFDLNGVGLGTGKGQKLVLPIKRPDEIVSKANKLCQRCGKNCVDGCWNKERARYRVLDDPTKIEAMVILGLHCEEV